MLYVILVIVIYVVGALITAYRVGQQIEDEGALILSVFWPIVLVVLPFIHAHDLGATYRKKKEQIEQDKNRVKKLEEENKKISAQVGEKCAKIAEITNDYNKLRRLATAKKIDRKAIANTPCHETATYAIYSNDTIRWL